MQWKPRLFLLFTGLVLLSHLLAGCIPIVFVKTVQITRVVPLANPPAQACTLAGCIDSLRVNLRGSLPQQFTVKLVGSDGSQVASNCDLAQLALGQDACDDLQVEYFGEYILFRQAPASASLRLEWPDGSLEREVTPAYEWFYPNGPQCEPKCRTAQVELEIP